MVCTSYSSWHKQIILQSCAYIHITQRSPVSLSPHHLFSDFKIFANLISMKWRLILFNIFLIISEDDHLFLHYWSFAFFVYVNCPEIYICPISIGVFGYYLKSWLGKYFIYSWYSYFPFMFLQIYFLIYYLSFHLLYFCDIKFLF